MHSFRDTYPVQSQETVDLEETMKVPEQDQNGDEFQLVGVAIEVWPKLDSLGNEKPKKKGCKGREWSYQFTQGTG